MIESIEPNNRLMKLQWEVLHLFKKQKAETPEALDCLMSLLIKTYMVSCIKKDNESFKEYFIQMVSDYYDEYEEMFNILGLSDLY